MDVVIGGLGGLQEVKKIFSVESIPCVVIITPDGRLVNANARPDIQADPDAEHFPYVCMHARVCTHGLDGCIQLASICGAEAQLNRPAVDRVWAAAPRSFCCQGGTKSCTFLFVHARWHTNRNQRDSKEKMTSVCVQ